MCYQLILKYTLFLYHRELSSNPEAVRHRNRRELIKLTDPQKYAAICKQSQERYTYIFTVLPVCSLKDRLEHAERQLKALSSSGHLAQCDSSGDALGESGADGNAGETGADGNARETGAEGNASNIREE